MKDKRRTDNKNRIVLIHIGNIKHRNGSVRFYRFRLGSLNMVTVVDKSSEVCLLCEDIELIQHMMILTWHVPGVQYCGS
jgi:hypothetical protein